MGQVLQIFLLIMYLQTFNRAIAALTDTDDFVALSALKANWQQIPPSWVGSDPCGGGWEGIVCTNSRITSIVLAGMGITGTLSGDIGNLPQLQTLDLSQNQGLRGPLPSSVANLKNLQNLLLVGCGFSGPIPERIGSLTQLVSLSLASNNFTGPIPPSIGNLSNLYMLDLTDNKLDGTIPVSSGTSPGLDLLLNARHFHLGKNQLTGAVPPNLFSSKMKLIHLLLDSNQLSGNIPSTLEEVQSLESVRLDRNSFGGPVLLNFTSLISLSELYLSNNELTGTLPDLTGVNLLTYVDMSNNSFSASSIPLWFSSLPSLTSLIMERTQLEGAIPATLFNAAQLQSIVLSNNRLNGTLDIGVNYSSQLQLIDMQRNSITEYAEGTGYNRTLLLQGNPYCEKTGSSKDYCASLQQPNSSYSTAQNCLPGSCKTNQIRSPNCNCAFPISGTLYFRAFSFSDFENASYYVSLDTVMMESFKNDRLPVDSISLSVPIKNPDDYLQLKLDAFPSATDRFNRTGLSMITSQLNNITFIKISYFGPFYFILDNDGYFAGLSKSSNTGVIIGATVGGFILMALLLVAGVYAFRQKKRAARAIQLGNPFASWDKNKSSGAPPQIKGVKSFSFEELKKCTNNFSDANILGTGGYGKVYMGILISGEKVAIKRAQQGSLQGSAEFKNEIELLTRLHHRNLVSLVGFCYELGEQMLVYEYISNGTLKDNISGKRGIQLSWTKRLTLALDSAKGIAYLHEFADPPIIHRDIKSTNILLDDHFIAKVADFGLSKPFGTGEGHVTTGVKGTMGYMDPEYFMTEQLTEKSDVYSFGVVMLELLTGRNPIEHGTHIVRKVRMAMDNTKDLYNLHEILDPAIRLSITLKGLEKFVDLAIRCVEETRAERPTMGEVVKELEAILQLPGLDYDSEMLSTSVSYSGTTTQGSSNKPSNMGYFEYSGSFWSF